jgi:hypothetical protein
VLCVWDRQNRSLDSVSGVRHGCPLLFRGSGRSNHASASRASPGSREADGWGPKDGDRPCDASWVARLCVRLSRRHADIVQSG